MSSSENIILHTYQPTRDSNRRFVTGLTNNEGTVWEESSHYKYGDRNPPYNPPLEDLTLQVPVALADRLFSFHKAYLEKRTTNLYNCHRFGLWMIGSESLERFEGLWRSEAIQQVMLEGQATEGEIQLGQLGVVGYLDSPEAYPFHSVIGLGRQPETAQCMQVSGMGGRLTVSSTADATGRYYSEEHPPGVLYTIPEQSAA